MGLTDHFDRGWCQDPAATAYVRGERSWTYEEAGRTSHRVAHALLAAGLEPGAKVAVLAPNDPVAWICAFGVWRARLSWVPLNPGQPVREVGALLAAFDCELLFVDASAAAAVEPLRASLPGLRLVCLGPGGPAGVPELAEWVAGHPDDAPIVERAPEDVVVILPTGGTTGLSKGVMHTHRSFDAAFAHLMLACHYRADEPVVSLAAGPLGTGMLTIPVLARGGTVVTLDGPEPTAILDAIERHRVTELVLPPTVIYRLLETPGVEARDFSSLRYLLYAASTMSTDKLRRAIGVFGPVLTEAYGQVEAFGVSYLRPEEHLLDGQVAPDERLASCGRPYPLVRVEIHDLEGRPVAPGVTGEICVRGDSVMRGYYRDPEQTERSLAGGWLHTGDLGHLDERGYLFATGRMADLVDVDGVLVHPGEIEQVIWGHPLVQECAVIGVAGPDGGAALLALVEPVPGARPSEAELVALCADRLGPERAPRRVEVVAALPRNPSGKVLKRELRERYAVSQDRSTPR